LLNSEKEARVERRSLSFKMIKKIRVGNGFDFHRLEKGSEITLAGLKLPSEYKIIAHSDGDIILHTIVDAILGGISIGDIGTLFPDTSSKWKDASSVIFLKEALKMMNEMGYLISNLDVTIMCEKPKITPIRKLLCENLQKLMNLNSDEISLKATTTDKMGFLGRGEGIGCFATICLIQ
jgi:2-C-methyl-D-erythritol 2,4-cyclodiphosphate synthase